MSLYDDQAEVVYFSQLDLYFHHMPIQWQDLLRLIVAKITHPFGTPHLINAVNGVLISLVAFVATLEAPMEEVLRLIADMKGLVGEMKMIQKRINIVDGLRQKNCSEYRMWQIFWKIGLAPELGERKGAILAGTWVAMIFHDQKVNLNSPVYIYKVLLGESDELSIKAQRSLAKLELKANIRFEGHDQNGFQIEIPFMKRLEIFFRGKLLYADDKTRQLVLDHQTLTPNEFLHASIQLKMGLDRNDAQALLIIVSSLLGLPRHLATIVPLLNANIENWGVVIDIDTGCIMFDLALVAPNGASPIDQKVFMPGNTILVKPMPNCVLQSLLKLRNENPNAQNLGDLVSNTDQSMNFNVTKFINSVARIAVQHAMIDPFHAAMISNDFRIIPHSKLYYRQTSRQQIWEASAKFFEVVGWGAPTSFVDGLSFGSCAVVRDEEIMHLFQGLADGVERLRPAPRASIIQLKYFHDAFCAFTATLAIFCLGLRERNPFNLQSADYVPGQAFILINDKKIHGLASLQPVTISTSLGIQLEYWRLHCDSMVYRLQRSGVDLDNSFMKALSDILDQKKSPLFVMSEPDHALKSAHLKCRWHVPVIENFGRHFWETNFSSVGISSREISAHLRHQSSGNLNWSASSDLVLRDLTARITKAQEEVLAHLKIKPVHGLTKRVRS